MAGSKEGRRKGGAAACDLLIVVRNPAEYDWDHAKRDLRYKVPFRRREIAYINLYICPWNYIESHNTSWLYLALSQGGGRILQGELLLPAAQAALQLRGSLLRREVLLRHIRSGGRADDGSRTGRTAAPGSRCTLRVPRHFSESAAEVSHDEAATVRNHR